MNNNKKLNTPVCTEMDHSAWCKDYKPKPHDQWNKTAAKCTLKHVQRKTERLRKQMKIQFVGTFVYTSNQ